MFVFRFPKKSRVLCPIVVLVLISKSFSVCVCVSVSHSSLADLGRAQYCGNCNYFKKSIFVSMVLRLRYSMNIKGTKNIKGTMSLCVSVSFSRVLYHILILVEYFTLLWYWY